MAIAPPIDDAKGPSRPGSLAVSRLSSRYAGRVCLICSHHEPRLGAPSVRARLLCILWAHVVAGSKELIPSPTHSYDTGAASGYFTLQAHLMGWRTHGMYGFDHARAIEAARSRPSSRRGGLRGGACRRSCAPCPPHCGPANSRATVARLRRSPTKARSRPLEIRNDACFAYRADSALRCGAVDGVPRKEPRAGNQARSR